jgi:hypothetical protein
MAKPKPVSFFADEELLARIDRWRASQPDVPGKSEAMRRLIEAGLSHLDQPSAQ